MDILKHKNKILAGFLAVLIVIAIISAINFYNDNTLEQTKDTYTHEAGKELVLNAADFFDADEKKAEQITFDISAVDKDVVGEYVVKANFKDKEFEIKVTVEDTTAPMVEFSDRYVFTNDIENTSFNNMLGGVYDASEWSAKLVRFEHKENLSELDEDALKRFTDEIPVPCDAQELQAVGTTDIPTEEGVYRAVMEIVDVHGNTTLEEVYVIYDATGARIDDVEDKVVYVEKDDLEKEPEVNKADYSITDNVDGKISEENFNCELELRDEEKHEWLVYVSYIDRAGNESKAEFLITVKEKKNETVNNQGGSNNAGNGGTASNEGAGNGGNASDNGNTNNNGGESYDPADADKDGIVDGEEASDYIHPSEQAVIDAGYGVVVQIDANTYSVLTHGDANVNGKHGFDILAEYLASMDLYANNMSGCWIDSDKDLYRCIATNITELITPDDEEFWD